MHNNKEKLVGYDFQGWPIFKMTLKEVLLGLGGKEEDNKIIFDANDPSMKIFPSILEDDGMGYGVNKQCIVEAEVFKSNEENTDKIYVNIFRADIPTEKEQNRLFDRWNTEEKEFREAINARNNNKNFRKF